MAEIPSSIDSVMFILSDFSEHRYPGSVAKKVDNAKTLVNLHVQGLLYRGKIRIDKLLHSMLDNAIGNCGRRHTALAILEAKQHANPVLCLCDIAESWLTHLIFPIQATGNTRRRPPSPALTPTLDNIENASRGDHPSLRSLVSQRQGNRCAITGDYSSSLPDALVPPGSFVATCQASHILPYLLDDFEDKDEEFIKATITWDMLKMWGSYDIQQLVGSKINGPANAILLRFDCRIMFEKFMWRLEPVNAPNQPPNCYQVKSDRSITISGSHVIFTNQADKPIDLPDAELVALHAALSRVIYASGAAEYFDTIWQNENAMHALSADGASDLGVLLSRAFLPREIMDY